jgi:hypothetical protein
MGKKRYKIWIEVEEYDPVTEHHRTLDLPFASSVNLGSEKAARTLAEHIHGVLMNTPRDTIRALSGGKR